MSVSDGMLGKKAQGGVSVKPNRLAINKRQKADRQECTTGEREKTVNKK